jgi:hypothetical protein
VRKLIIAALLALMLASVGGAAAAKPSSSSHSVAFIATLSGDEEVQSVETNARGIAIFRPSADGSSLSYVLIAANIEDVTSDHIHLAAVGEDGPVVVSLIPSPLPGRQNGILAEGTITASDLVGPLAGEPLSALLSAMESGDTYVNVHTTAHPGGEIRGQVRGIG